LHFGSLSLAFFPGLVAEDDIPDPTNKDHVEQANPDAQKDPAFGDPNWRLIGLRAAHVAEARNLTKTGDD
jgi:hypothetical protein